MNRRGFIGALAGIAAQMTLDPELALWKPGAKLISIPKPRVWPKMQVGDTFTISGIYRVNPVNLNHTPNPKLREFIVTGNENGKVSFFPPKILNTQYKNCHLVKEEYDPIPILQEPSVNTVYASRLDLLYGTGTTCIGPEVPSVTLSST